MNLTLWIQFMKTEDIFTLIRKLKWLPRSLIQIIIPVLKRYCCSVYFAICCLLLYFFVFFLFFLIFGRYYLLVELIIWMHVFRNVHILSFKFAHKKNPIPQYQFNCKIGSCVSVSKTFASRDVNCEARWFFSGILKPSKL